MLKTIIVRALWLLILFSLLGCPGFTGKNIYLNPKYKEPVKPNARLAIVPLTSLGNPLPCPESCPPLEQATDDYFEKTFNEISQTINVVPLSSSRHYFQKYPIILRQILQIKYSDQNLNNGPKLQETIGSDSLKILKKHLEEADLLLIPLTFNFVPKFNRLFGYSEFHLYDLNSGSLIYASSRNIAVNRVDEPGRGLLAFVLIAKGREDFDTLYLNR